MIVSTKITTFPFLKRRSFKMKERHHTQLMPLMVGVSTDRRSGKTWYWWLRNKCISIQLNSPWTTGQLSAHGPGGFQALFTAPSAARYQTPQRHSRLRAPHCGTPDSGKVVSGAPWIQTRTSPDAPATTECVSAQTGIPHGADARVRASVRAPQLWKGTRRAEVLPATFMS